MMPCSNKPIRMLMDLSLVFLNSVMFLFVKFSSAVQQYCCSRCTLLNFFLLTLSRKCVNLYIMNINTRLTCWDMEILIWCFGSYILKQETFIFQNNGEQSKLNALNNKSRNMLKTHSLMHTFFLVQNAKNVWSLCAFVGHLPLSSIEGVIKWFSHTAEL